MLTTTELTQARADVLETLVSDVTIQRASISTDDAGYSAESWSTSSTVKGRIDNVTRTSGTDMIAMQEMGRAFYQLTVTWDADLKDGDRVVISSVTYEAKSVNAAQDDRIVKRAVVVKVS